MCSIRFVSPVSAPAAWRALSSYHARHRITARMHRSWVPAWGVAAVVLAGFTYYSAASMTHGFLTAYAASKLLVAGNLGPDAYDDRWFGAYVQAVTQSAVREIFIPNPPTMAL